MSDHQLRSACRIVVLISGNGSNLQAMIDAGSEGRIQAEVVAVVSNRAEAYGLERARSASIPTHILDHCAFPEREIYDEELSRLVSGYNPDLIVLAGFMRILGRRYVSDFENRIMNIHPSLLPLYPGLHTHQRALDAGDKVHGATVHFVTPELDAGPIIIQGQIPVLPDDTADLLQQRIHKVEHSIYPRAVEWFAAGRLRVDGDQVLLDNRRDKNRVFAYDRHGLEIN
jgi:phosphoribosylglycinamide formyltransferase-1